MIGHEIGPRNGEELVRFVRALGQHRYVASRLHLVHAFVFDALAAAGAEGAAPEACAWAEGVLSDPEIDPSSKDERLHRRSTDVELVAALTTFWVAGDAQARASARLRERLAAVGAPFAPGARAPFDEDAEEDVFPVLADAGWELVPITKFDPERHKGALGAFGDPLAFEVARFDEENAVPPVVTLHELPLVGAAELLEPFGEFGDTDAPFTLWTSGNDVYLDYVMRGVMKVAKLL